MDDSNPFIEFDESGECNCCRAARSRQVHEWFPGDEGRKRLNLLVNELRRAGRGRDYDAMIGLSGGVDSSYLAHFLRTEFDLRLLAVHVDAGWDSEAAVRNIELLTKALSLDLHCEVLEWGEVRDLQLAFLRASVLNQDIPQDHAFLASLFRLSRKYGVTHFASGVNFSSECVVPPHWGYPATDGKHLRAIHKLFGEKPLTQFPVISAFEYVWQVRIQGRPINVYPLNYLPYDKEKAKKELIDKYGYRDYGQKHQESRFTKFYQDCYLPKRYGFDKRRLHYSSLIVSGQLSREEALKLLEQPIIDPTTESRDMKFVAKKLGISVANLESLIQLPVVNHEDYPNNRKLFELGTKVKRMIKHRRWL
jgi:N-acetyl sugar amidotransferase